MSFKAGYLTQREQDIWDLRRRRLSQSQIGRIMGVTRQAIHKSYQVIDQKIEQAFFEAADASHLEPSTINLVEGIMEAYSPPQNVPVVVSLSKTNGIKIWYISEDRCNECKLEKSCRQTLENEAEERGVETTATDNQRPPILLAAKIFRLKEG